MNIDTQTAADEQTKAPQVSIGMPVYNGESFIREAIDSLVAQTFTDFELIISDNASTDKTEAICREYAAKETRIRYVRQTTNRGAVENFRFVLDQAVGEYFMWAAADDVWNEAFIDACKQRLDGNSEYGLAITSYKCVSRLSSFLNRSFADPLHIVERGSGNERLWEYTKMPFSTHKDNLVYSLFRRQILNDVIQELQDLFGENAPIGAAMNELVIFRNKGAYVSNTLFFKCYRLIPPGHRLAPVFRLLSKGKRALQGKTRNRAKGQSGRIFIQQLTDILTHVDVDVDQKAKILDHWSARVGLSQSIR